MQIRLNGENVYTQCRSLMGLIDEKGFETKALIAEHNFTVIRQDEWEDTRIQDGDTVELLSLVGGG